MTDLNQLFRKNKDKFEEYFTSRYPLLVMYIMKYIDDLELSKDLSQDCFVILWNNKNYSFKNYKALDGFMYRTAKNLALNKLKHIKVTEKFATSISQIEEKDIISKNEIYEILHNQLEKLAPRSKEVIRLQLMGFRDAEIAEQMNISVNTVHTLKKGAYKKLKKTLPKDISSEYILFLLFI